MFSFLKSLFDKLKLVFDFSKKNTNIQSIKIRGVNKNIKVENVISKNAPRKK